jgi:F-box and WD-40 domain protein MET30
MNNGQTLVSGSFDETIKLWNWSTGECLSTLQTPGSTIRSLAVINFD